MKTQTGMTLKQFAAWRFMEALEAYRVALESHDSAEIVRASLTVYCARRNEADRKAINRVWRSQVSA